MCAGSGAVGLEAWSRGAGPVELVEKFPKALGALKKNVEKISQAYPELLQRAPLTIRSYSVESYIKGNNQVFSEGKKTCWFFDPPYSEGKLYERIVSKIVQRLRLEDELWVQFGRLKSFSLEQKEAKTFVQGTNHLCCYVAPSKKE